MSYQGLGQKKSGTPKIASGRGKSGKAGGGGPTASSGQQASGTPKLGVSKRKNPGGTANFAQLGSEVRGYRKFGGASGSGRKVGTVKKVSGPSGN